MTRREKRTMLIGAVLVALGVLVRAVPEAATRYVALRDRLSQQLEWEQRATALIATRSAAERSRDLAERTLDSVAGILVPGANPNDAVTSLSALVGLWAADNAVVVEEMQGSVDMNVSPFPKLTMRFRTHAELAGWLAWMDAIESAPVALVVEDLDLSVIDAGAEDATRIRSNMQLSSWFRPGRSQ